MTWKNWSYWIKGSIVSFVVLSAIILFISFSGLSINSSIFLKIFYEYPSSFIADIICGPGSLESFSCSIITVFAMIPILTIIYSLIIGVIYDLIKNRKKRK